jgi:hypothetical protein
LNHDYKIFVKRKKFKINVALIDIWLGKRKLYVKRLLQVKSNLQLVTWVEKKRKILEK